MGKIPKYKVNYEDPSPARGRQCFSCIHEYINVALNKTVCSQVDGGIRWEAYCDLWKAGTYYHTRDRGKKRLIDDLEKFEVT